MDGDGADANVAHRAVLLLVLDWQPLNVVERVKPVNDAAVTRQKRGARMSAERAQSDRGGGGGGGGGSAAASEAMLLTGQRWCTCGPGAAPLHM